MRQYNVLFYYSCIENRMSKMCVASGKQVASEALDGPQDELVTGLRARIRELEQRQDWLLREGETLQVRQMLQSND
jgi:hypothetical protein